MDLTEVRIRTDRLLLTPISMDYAEVIFVEFTDEVTRLMYPAAPKEIKETTAFIERSLAHLEDGRHLTMVILNETTEEFLGCAGVHELGSVTPELGVWLKKSAHGNHYGHEAVQALVNWARCNLTCSALRYPVDERNVPSRRIPERLGGRITGQSVETSMSGRELRLLSYDIPLTGEDLQPPCSEQ